MKKHTPSPTHLRILAGLLAIPTEESVATLQALAEEHTWLQSAIPQLVELPLTEWRAEHTRLFINGHPKTACPPFESVYREGLMNGPVCHSIGHLYHAIGLAPIEGLSTDYLGVLLECAAYLLESDSLKTAYWDELWEGHLAQWVPEFAKDLAQQTSIQLYQQLALQLQDLF